MSPKDLLKINANGVEVIFSPLNWQQKLEIASKMKMKDGKEILDHGMQLFLTIKYSVKEIKGIELMDSTPFQVDKEGDVLTDDSASMVLDALSTVNLLLPVMSGIDGKLESFKEQGIVIEYTPKKSQAS